MPSDRRIPARAMALLAVILWSTAASAFKLSLEYLSPYMLLLLSSAVSLGVLWVLDLAGGGGRRLPDRRAALRGLLNPFLYYLVLLTAYDMLPAQIAMVINYLWPIMLVLLSIPVLGQRIGLLGVGAVLVSFGGVAVLALGAGGDLSGAGPGPMLLALLSTVIWAAYWLLNMKSRGSGVSALRGNFQWGLLYLLAYGLITGALEVPVAQGLLGAAYVGLFEMSLTYVVWLAALSRARTTVEVSSMIYLTPFLSLLIIAVSVGERISPWTVAGLVLVIAGIVLERGLGRVGAVGGRG
ncbi:MAG: DMT family transporter [Candidatus Fermentibacteraceae bacterium]